MVKFIFTRIFRLQYVQKIFLCDHDLSAFKEKPSASIILGLFLIVLSYVICWPVIASIISLSIYLKRPVISLVAPVIYGFSHLVFITGMYLAGKRHGPIFVNWLIYKLLYKHYILYESDKYSSRGVNEQ
ncbi:MAG: hypothetical protein PF637_03695 [Spirochaetes bacterium]|jgi:hypothetical protein|nr:hypothetical protein [Spirochaetota bacterium]